MIRRVKISVILLLSLFYLPLSGQPVNLTITIDSVPVTCFDGSDGSITVTDVSPGTPPYTYYWTHGVDTLASGSDTTISGLSPGYYFIHVYGSGPLEYGVKDVQILNAPPINIGFVWAFDVSCKGQDDGFIQISAASSRSLEYSIDSGDVWQSVFWFDSLAPSTNYIMVRDDSMCTETYSLNPVIISEPDALSIDDTSSTPLACFGTPDATISVDVGGGTDPKTYTLWPDGSVWNNDGEFSGVGPGSYSVEVEDANGCMITAETFSFSYPPQILITKEEFTPNSCDGKNDGAISVDASGGSGTLDYRLFPDGTATDPNGEFPNLPPDTYYVQVEDDSNCTVNTINFDLEYPDPISILDEDTVPIQCNGANDGEIRVQADGGTLPYNYRLMLPGPVVVDSNDFGIFNTVAPGTGYYVSVTDVNFCSPATSSSWDFEEPDAISLVDVDTNDITCSTAGDGSITVNVTGGTPPYKYTLLPDMITQDSATFADLDSGLYSVSVTDVYDCTPLVVTDLKINEPGPIQITFANKINISCNGYNDGQIIVQVDGGTDPLRFILKDPTTGIDTNNTGVFGPLPGGTYSVDVTDTNNCPAQNSGTLNLVDPDTIFIYQQDTTPITCNNENDGTITIRANGGTLPLEYSLFPGTSKNDDGDFIVTPGIGYHVIVTDDNDCPADTSLYWDFINPDLLGLTPLDTNDITCFGKGDGSLSVVANGGTLPYSYTISPPGTGSQPDSVFSGLGPDTYSVSVTDRWGCDPAQVDDMVINEPAPITINSIDNNDITCNGLIDGSIIVSASGGTDTLYYTLTPGPTQPDSTFSSLPAGTYDLSITDVNGCTPATATDLVIEEPPAISITDEDTTGITCYGANDAIIDITATGGTGVLTFILQDPADVDTNTSGYFPDLGPGTYTVEVDDENGCGPDTSNQFIFTEPGEISASLAGTSDTVLTCYGDSTGSMDITISGGSPPFTFAWTGPDDFNSTSQNISGLKAGLYSLIVTDDNNCSRTYDPFDTITGPPEYLMSFTKKDITCYDASDDTVWVNASGGSPPYMYDDGYGPYASNMFVGLGAGPHILEVIDLKSCVISDTVFIDIPLELKIDSETAVDSMQKCNGDSNGIIILTASGGTGTKEYSIDSGYTFFPGNVFTGLGGGTYYSAVKDQNGCVAYKSALIISNPSILYIDQYAQDNIETCSDAEEGEVRIKAAGGTPVPGMAPYIYVIDMTDTSYLGRFPDLPAGPHTIDIYDDNGCTIDTTIVITAPLPIIVASSATDVTTCYEDSAGVIAIVATGGTGLTKGYILQGDTTLHTDTVYYNQLLGRSYDFTIFDSLGCEMPHNEVIDSPDSIATDSVIVLPVTCTGDTDGEIRIYGSGGTPPYHYILDPGTDTSYTGIYSNLLPGDYTISVHDTMDCKPYVTPTLTVIEPPVLVFDSSAQTTISCGGMNDGMISVYVSGGLSPYTYSVDTGASFDTASVITGIGPGTYIIVVQDASGCSVRGDTVTFIDPPGLSLDPVTITDVSDCAGDSTGAIGLSASGGTGGLEFSLDSVSWQDSGTFAGLPAGIYTAYVRDERSCLSAFPPTTIAEPLPISASITTTTAMIPDPGSINISATGGTAPFEYSIDSGYTFTSDTFYLVPSEIYWVVIRDSNSCIHEETVYVSATPPLDVNVSSLNVDCYNNNNGSIALSELNGIGTVLYSIDGGLTTQSTSDFPDLGGGTYFIEVTDSHRVFRDTVEIIEPPAFDVSGTVTPATCSRNSFDGTISLTVSGATPPYDFLWSNDSTSEDLSGLEENTYTITITDQTGCEYIETYEVTAFVTLYADAGADTTVCYGAEVMLNGSGGDEFTWSPEAGLSQIDIPDPISTITDSVAYVLFTRDVASGCVDQDTVILTIHPDRGISAGQDTTVAPGQTITLMAIGGPFDSYLWEPSDGLDNPMAQSTIATISTEIIYVVTGTTEFGCPESDSMSIFIATGLNIYSGFTPNDDGINDLWDIDDIVFYPNATVKVFDRWGKVVFSSVGYADNQRWDGKYKGKDLPTGTYYYIIDLKDGGEPYKGPVTIVR